MEVPDFSAATDLCQVVANVYEMRLVRMHLRRVVLLVAATRLPFLPVVLLAMPTETIFAAFANLLL